MTKPQKHAKKNNMTKSEMEKEIDELAERGLTYLFEKNISFKTSLKKLAVDAYQAGMEAARNVYRD